jgi:hypothetical protein
MFFSINGSIRATTMDIREQIARIALTGRYTITEVADLFEVSRPTAHALASRRVGFESISTEGRSRSFPVNG